LRVALTLRQLRDPLSRRHPNSRGQRRKIGSWPGSPAACAHVRRAELDLWGRASSLRSIASGGSDASRADATLRS